AATARSATLNLMTVFNSGADGGNSNMIIPVRLWLRCTATNTSASQLNLVIYTDGINRYTSGGSTLTGTPIIQSGETGYVAPTSKATIKFGELVTTAASSEVRVYDREIRTTILAVDDTFDIWFGDGVRSTGEVVVTGHFETQTVIVPPVYLRPQATMIIDTYGASQAADPAWEVEFWYLDHEPGSTN
ncbi:hypothetical protein LCGC14_1260130, partial [marine sediment metagenome]